MSYSVLPKLRIGLFVTAFIALATITARAQEQIGGPYTVDENTVLLMHFDGDLSNVSDSSADGIGHGDVSFVNNSGLGLGQALRLTNDSQSDSSYVTVPDTSALDLTKSWTIEGWINIFSFGEGSDDWRWVPRLINKPGEDAFYTGNYYMEVWGSDRLFKVGYHTTASGSGNWIEVNSPSGIMEPGTWYHWAYIRDAENHVLISMISDAEGNVKFFGVNPYDPISEDPPLVNDNPVHIGFAGGGTDSWLDGFVDELRVSNSVRSFPIPPVFTQSTELSNQESGKSYDVSASVYKLGSGTIDNVKVHYNTGNGWEEAALSNTDGMKYEGSIPAASTGTIVQYYYSATDNEGRVATIPNTAESDSTYLSFGVYKPGSQTLALDFENGSGNPVDNSMYSHEATLLGNPTYSEDAEDGTYSMYFEGDSSAVQFSSPFLRADSLQAELWFKADSLPAANTRLFAKQGAGAWWQTNFQINFQAGGIIAGGSYMPERSDDPYVVNVMQLDSTIKAQAWYKAVYQVTPDTAYFALFDSTEALLDITKLNVTGLSPYLADGPLSIATAGDPGQNHFAGYIDNVNLYNYPKDDMAKYSTATAIDEGGLSVPQKVTLKQNYPNPFNPTTKINFALPQAQKVTLTVYDMLGREVATLINGTNVTAGSHQVTFDASNLSSGVYIYRLQAQGQSITRKMLLLK